MKKKVLFLTLLLITVMAAVQAKTLVVYYSYTGNCKAIANALASQITADLLEIQPAQAQVTAVAIMAPGTLPEIINLVVPPFFDEEVYAIKSFIARLAKIAAARLCRLHGKNYYQERGAVARLGSQGDRTVNRHRTPSRRR